MPGDDVTGELDTFLAQHHGELVEFRRDLHAHPEIGYHEHRTTREVATRLTAAGLRPMVLPKGTGLIVDVGQPGPGPIVALRADIDALPIADEKDVPYRSTAANACHACGHDVHTSILTGTGVFLAGLAAQGRLPGRVRLIFQPAEEVPGGALDVLAAGGIAGVERIFALHCDPRLDVGKVGIRSGPITAACDKITVRVTGPGGHTARPHLTADLVYALGKIVTELPAALTRRVDPRSSLSLVWGRISAGTAANAIPDDGVVEGTVRCLDDEAWQAAPDMLKALIDSVAGAYGVFAELDYQRNVPPTVNEAVSAAMLSTATQRALGPEAVASTPQSLGGEDFAWYLESIPGALARLGTRGEGFPEFDIHQATFDVDERAIGVGVRLLTETSLVALRDAGGTAPVDATSKGGTVPRAAHALLDPPVPPSPRQLTPPGASGAGYPASITDYLWRVASPATPVTVVAGGS
jgi:amidohydrolase